MVYEDMIGYASLKALSKKANVMFSSSFFAFLFQHVHEPASSSNTNTELSFTEVC